MEVNHKQYSGYSTRAAETRSEEAASLAMSAGCGTETEESAV